MEPHMRSNECSCKNTAKAVLEALEKRSLTDEEIKITEFL